MLSTSDSNSVDAQCRAAFQTGQPVQGVCKQYGQCCIQTCQQQGGNYGGHKCYVDMWKGFQNTFCTCDSQANNGQQPQLPNEYQQPSPLPLDPIPNLDPPIMQPEQNQPPYIGEQPYCRTNCINGLVLSTYFSNF